MEDPTQEPAAEDKANGMGDWEWADKASQIAEKQLRVRNERQAKIQEASITAARQAGNARCGVGLGWAELL